MNGFSLELPLTIIATLGAALAVTSARRGAWIALIIAATAVALLEFHPTDAVPLTLVLRLAAIYGAILVALPPGLLTPRALTHDLAPRRIASTLSEHPVVVATAAAGLLLGAIPLALPIEGSSTLLRSAGVAMLLIGLPPLLTSRYVEATARAAVVTLSGALLLRAAILGPLDALSSLVIAGGFAALLLTGTAVAGQLTKAEEA
ncbi:MAG: hypothetical protein DWI70_04745 [Chloroflexi bacterium]|nr:MAG: hypothetical protein DWI47_02110 [Chloroflexota bacterium]RLT55991.1 MAG: hypothetical protein DWI70_04745 [Chloroflexota bacterium]